MRPEILDFKIESRDVDPLVTVCVPKNVSKSQRYEEHRSKLERLEGGTFTAKTLLRIIKDIFCYDNDMHTRVFWHIITPESQAALTCIYNTPMVSNHVLLDTIQSERCDYWLQYSSFEVRQDLVRSLPSDLKGRIHWVLRNVLLSTGLAAYDKSCIDRFTIEQLLCGVEDETDKEAEAILGYSDEWRIHEWTSALGKILYVGGYPGDNPHGYGVWFGEDGIIEPLWSESDGYLAPCCPDYTVHERFVDTGRYGSDTETETDAEADAETED